MNIVIMCGIPGSGKSTYARSLKHKIILSKDSIREMIHGEYKYDPDTEGVVKEMLYSLCSSVYVLCPSYTIVIDETNINKKKRKEWLDLFSGAAQITCVYCSSIDGNLDRRMTNSRGMTREKWEGVIESMKNSFEKPYLDEGFDKIIEVTI